MRTIFKLSIFGISSALVILFAFFIISTDQIGRPSSGEIPESDLVQEFSGESAYKEVLHQVSLGPRNPGSAGHSALQDYIAVKLTEFGYIVEVQPFVHKLPNGSSLALKNIVAKRGNENNGIFALGAHYDTRPISDKDTDPEKKILPILGANDGASGVAVLLELARVYSKADLPVGLWFLFFDAEDIGDVYGPYSLGSSVFVSGLSDDVLLKMKGVIIVDMVGDSDLEIFYERNSFNSVSRGFTEKIWEIGSDLGYSDIFRPNVKYDVYDDHIAFLQKGIPTSLIIDLDYEFWHTQGDTSDKVSASSLQIVGRVLVKSIEALIFTEPNGAFGN